MLEAVDHPEQALTLLAWWRGAGVDVNVEDQPFDWLSTRADAISPPKRDAQHTTSNRSRTAPHSEEAMPQSLSALRAWLGAAPFLVDAGPPERRLVASGMAGADVMIVTDMPEADDHDKGQLFSGTCGRLLDEMLAAIGQSRETVYIAPLCPGRPATGQISRAGLPRLSEIMRHHIALVVPKRLWLLGSTASRAVLGMDDVASTGNLHDFNHATVKVPTVASFAPRFLLDHPQQKARVWADMQALIKGI